MFLINQTAEIMHGPDTLLLLEQAGRTCYKSEKNITRESCRDFVRARVKEEHHTILEHLSVTVRFTCDRGISHELVRHRLATFSQESTRFCNYKGGVTFVAPSTMPDIVNLTKVLAGRNLIYVDIMDDLDNLSKASKVWLQAMLSADGNYIKMLELGCTPQIARAVLPNSVKTEVVMTANLREWRHFFNLRALGKAGRPHPDMVALTVPLLAEFIQRWPEVFEDLIKGGVR